MELHQLSFKKEKERLVKIRQKNSKVFERLFKQGARRNSKYSRNKAQELVASEKFSIFAKIKKKFSEKR